MVTTGDQTYGSVKLMKSAILVGDNVTVSGTVDSESGESNSLAVNASGVTNFQGVVGGVDALGSLDVNGAAILNGDVTTINGQTYDDVTALGTSIVLSATEVAIEGELVPGGNNSAGQVIVNGNVSLGTGDTLTMDVDGATAISGYDQMRTAGANRVVNLAGSQLNLSLGFTPAVGDQFVLIDNVDASSSITGEFVGLAEGSLLAVGGTTF
jgi:hypothetical protein